MNNTFSTVRFIVWACWLSSCREKRHRKDLLRLKNEVTLLWPRETCNSNSGHNIFSHSFAFTTTFLSLLSTPYAAFFSNPVLLQEKNKSVSGLLNIRLLVQPCLQFWAKCSYLSTTGLVDCQHLPKHHISTFSKQHDPWSVTATHIADLRCTVAYGSALHSLDKK